MLQLVLQNAVKKSQKVTWTDSGEQLSKLYDKLKSYLKALESLDVMTNKCAAMSLPSVESSLSGKLLRMRQSSSIGATRNEQSDLSLLSGSSSPFKAEAD